MNGPAALERASEPARGPDTGVTFNTSLERLVSEAMAMAEPGSDLAALVHRFWRLVPDEDLEGRTPEAMLEATEAHLELAQQRLPGELKLRVERTKEHTVFEVATDDMPFLVDSVTSAITQAGHELDLLVHPQVVVVREALGALVEVRPDVEPDEAAAGDLVESWMRIEIGALRDDGAVAALRNDLQRVLTDVREAV